jgi:hypothetical protein
MRVSALAKPRIEFVTNSYNPTPQTILPADSAESSMAAPRLRVGLLGFYFHLPSLVVRFKRIATLGAERAAASRYLTR